MEPKKISSLLGNRVEPSSSEEAILETGNEQVSKQSSLTMLIGIFAGGNFMSSLLRLLGGFLIARIVEPSILGLFNAIGLVHGYAPLLQAGILNGLNRELPYYRGKNDHQRVQDLAASAKALTLLLSAFLASVLFGIAVFQFLHKNYVLSAGWMTYSLTSFYLFYGQLYLQVTYRTFGEFTRLAFFNIIFNGAALLFVIFVWLFKFYGLCLRAILSSFLALGLFWLWRPLKVHPKFNPRQLWHLFKIGAPIFGVGQLNILWTLLDSTLVLKFLGIKVFGLYALTTMTITSLQILPDAASSIIYPKMAEQYGRTGKLKDILKIAYSPILIITLGIIPVIILGWILMPSFIKWVLPKYMGGIAASQWALLSIPILCLASVNDAFNVIRRQDLYLLTNIIGILSYGGFLFWRLRVGIDLVFFPQAMLLGRFVYIIACYLILYLLVTRER